MRKERGNTALAFQQAEPTTQNRQKRRIAQRLKGLPAGEKILYLCSVIVCVALALLVTSRYAEVTELSIAIENQKQVIQEAKEVNLQMESELKQLGSMERIREFAKEKGLTFIPSIRP